MEAIEFVETKPKTFKERRVRISQIPKENFLVRPVVAGICGSDLHYYLGQKDPEKLKKRLPMPLLHEGVVKEVKTGKKFLINPLLPCQVCSACKAGMENYCQKAKFMASTAPGLARTLFIYPEARLIEIPKGVPDELAALSEPLAVALHALAKAEAEFQNKIAVIGDGPIGFFVTLLAFYYKKITKQNLFWLGRHQGKLDLAKNFATLINLKDPASQIVLSNLNEKIDIAIEAVGGPASQETINQSLQLVKPTGKVVLLGITDLQVPIKTIWIVNKGITVSGSNRSSQKELKAVLNLMTKPGFQKELKKIINPKIFKIKTASDLKRAFDFAAAGQTGRVMVEFIT